MTPCPDPTLPWLSGVILGMCWAYLSVGLFVACGGRVWVEKITSNWSQSE